MSENRTKAEHGGVLNMGEIERLLKTLAKQLEATKTLYVRYKGTVTDVREVPDHQIQLRALDELAKVWDLYPRSNRGQSKDPSDHCSGPTMNLVISSPKQSSAACRALP
jgi:hypothetical protein